ncbi:MAG: PAS domain S-box protein [Bacteroidota bacterium]
MLLTNPSRKVFTGVLLLLLFQICLGQTQTQLLSQIENSDDDQEKLLLFEQLAAKNQFTDNEKSIFYAQKAYDLAARIAPPHRQAYYLNRVAVNHLLAGDYLKSIQIQNEILTNFDSIGDSLYVEIHNSLGFSYHALGELNIAVQYGKKVMRLSQELDWDFLSLPALGILAKVNMDIGDYDSALSYFTQAAKKAQFYNQPNHYCYVHKDLTQLYELRGELPLAMDAAKKAIKTAKENNFKLIESDVRINLSNIYRKKSQYQKAIAEAQRAIADLEEIGSSIYTFKAYRSIVQIKLDLQDTDGALLIALENVEQALAQGNKKEAINFYQLLSQIYERKKDFKNALKYQNKAEELQNEKQQNNQIQSITLAEHLSDTNVPLRPTGDQSSQGEITSLGVIVGIFLLLAFLIGVVFARIGIFQKEILNDLFAQDTKSERWLFLQRIAIFAAVLNLPLAIHFYFWDIQEAFVIALILEGIYIACYFFLDKGRMTPVFYLASIAYIIFGLYPIFVGQIYAVPVVIVTIFFVLNLIIPKPFFQIQNLTFAILSLITYYTLVYHTQVSPVPYSEELDIAMTVISFLIIAASFSQYNKSLSTYRSVLLEKNWFLNQIANTNPHLIFTKNKNQELTFVNEAVRNYFKKNEVELIGKKDEEVANYFEEDMSFLKDDYQMLDGDTSKEQKLIVASGEEKWFETIKKPLYDSRKRIIGMLSVSRDITESKVAQAEIAASEQKYRMLFDLTFDGLLILNKNGQVVDCNDSSIQFMKLTTKHNLIGQHIHKVFDKVNRVLNLQEFLDSPLHFMSPFRAEYHDDFGHVSFVEQTFAKINYNGVPHIVCAFKNISEKLILEKKQKELLEKEFELSKLNNELVAQTISSGKKNKFLNELKHSMKSMLNSIRGAEKKELHKLLKMIEANLELEENFYDFKRKFEKNYPNFFSKLLDINPKLTQNDLKLSAYIRLGMSAWDIANLLFIEKKSVEMSKYRLKKKLNLNKEDDLNLFVNAI